MKANKIKLILFLIVILTCRYAYSADALFYKEANLMGGYSDEDEWIGEGQTLKNSVGFEFLKRFSNEYGDFLTADIQMRLAYNSEKDFEDAWGLEFHNAWLEYKLGLGKKIRAGHFTPAFGLEAVLDTHGTLFQTLAMKNLGFKKDWGAEYIGSFKSFDYEIAGQIGSGMGIEHKDGSYLFTVRIGRPEQEQFKYGLSLLYGDVLKAQEMKTFPRPDYLDDAINKKRIGLDAQYDFAPFDFKGELSFGENEDNDVIGGLLEANYTPPSLQKLKLTLQGQVWDNDMDELDTNDTVISFGVSYELTNSITIRAAYFHDIDAYGREEDKKVLVQLYYFGL